MGNRTPAQINYLSKQNEFLASYDLKQGDTLRVFCRARYFENGWNNSWSQEMNSNIGKELVFSRDCGESGIELKLAGGAHTGYRYPYFCLEIVKKINFKIWEDF